MTKTMRACAELVQRSGLAIFGIQFYGECWSGVGLEGKEATSFISLQSKSILNKFSISSGKMMYNFKESLIK